jgi:radical SAM protein with 4Fe4S-binding SPASM domain
MDHPAWPARLDQPAGGASATAPAPEAVPHVVAWNLTRRCNLECAHCYISAGSWQGTALELSTAECTRIADEILAVNPAPLFILSGGEPLLREDLEDIARHASSRGATVVVGTNGTRLTTERIRSLKAAGVTGVALSVDSLDETYHDRFRHGDGALQHTLDAIPRLREERLDFIVQTTLTRGNRADVARLLRWSADQGAVSFNLYFLVATGRGAAMHGLSPAENDGVLRELLDLEHEMRGRMLVRAKCQPQLMRHVHEQAPDSPLVQYATRCPCGVQYCRITPEGFVTPCPYLPEIAGSLRQQSFRDVFFGSELFTRLRAGALGGRCGRCEYREVCGGCRARAFAEHGDVLAEDPSCAYDPPGDRAVVRPSGPTYGAAGAATALAWTEGARRRMGRVPSFVRGVVEARVEAFARREGLSTVTEELLDRVRRELPVDFSKKLPFFARRGE